MDIAQQVFDSNMISGVGDADQYLTFILADEEYGVDILRVQEIKGWIKPTPIPNMPAYIKGVMNLRGTIVPIIDLRERFHMQTLAYGPTTVVIVLRILSAQRERIMGIVVDAVSEVYNIGTDAIKEPPDFGSVIETQFIQGLSTVDEKMIILLDIDHLLNSGELSILPSTEQ